MTTAAAAHSADVPPFRNIPLSQIAESPDNPRKFYDKAKLQELADSIREKGVLEPVLVRPHDGDYRVVCGHRRLRATKLAGLKEIPAIVRHLDDKQALEVQVIENLQREDVNPMEEAAAYEQLVKVHGHHPKELAAKIGKSVGYVYRRLKLCELAKPVREALAEERITAAVAELIARIPGAELQEQALRKVGATEWEPALSLKMAIEEIQREFMLDLAHAPFDVKDANLVAAAGSCSTCPKRAGNNPDLFGDVGKKDTCTDPGCFETKKLAATAIRVADATAKGVKVLEGAEAKKALEYGSNYVKLDEQCHEDPKYRTYKQLLGKKAETVLAVSGDGVLRELVPKNELNRQLKAAGHDFKTHTARSSGGGDSYAKQQREAQKKAKRLSEVGFKAMESSLKAVVADKPAVWAALAKLALRDCYGESDRAAKACGLESGAALEKKIATLNLPQLQAVIAATLLAKHSRMSAYQGGFDDKFKAVCAAAGVDLKKLEREVAAAEKKPTAKPAAKPTKKKGKA